MSDITLDQDSPNPHKPGSVQAALASRDFRLVWSGSFASNIGTWMQNVVLPAYVYHRTGKASLVGIMIFAQLGPLLFLSIFAGVLADKFDRRRWLISMQLTQLTFSIALATLALGEPKFIFIFLAALGVGIGNALNAPAWSAMLPSLVRPVDLPGALSLNSVVINGSRVVGPIIVAVLSQVGVTTAGFFFMNAATYLFVIFALMRVNIPSFTPDTTQGWRRFTSGISLARQISGVSRLLLTLASFSLFSLPYVGLFPAVAHVNFGIAEDGSTYKWGLGAALGGLAIGTKFSHRDQRKLVQYGFIGFAVSMVLFAVSRSAVPAFVFGFVLGFAYFFTTTAMSIVVQSRLRPEVRGRVMSLWFMSFGGTVPLGNMLFGPVVDQYGARWLLLFGAAWALFLAWWCNVAALDSKRGFSISQ
jgi:MFS family permease